MLIFGDRKGSGQIEGWSAYIFGVASLSGVPSYARGLVRRLIKRQTSYPVLLDWGGEVAESLGYRKEQAMVVVVAKNGTVLAIKYGAVSEPELKVVNSELDKQLPCTTAQVPFAGPVSAVACTPSAAWLP